MIKLFPILESSYNIYQVTVLLKNYKDFSKTEILDQIRAVPFVIRVKIEENDRLHQISKGHDYEYSLVKIKYLNVFGEASRGIKEVHDIIVAGHDNFHKIKGVIKFQPLIRTLKKIK